MKTAYSKLYVEMGVDFLKAISIKGTSALKGSIEVQGSKNTVLPIMAASLLADGVTVIHNCPQIQDVTIMCRLLECLGAKTHREGKRLSIDTQNIVYRKLPVELTKKLRSSVLLLGPMIARFQKACVGMPGGCAIGKRPIDIHLEGLMKMGVDVSFEGEMLCCNCYHLQGTEYRLSFKSVGATENLLMAATRATGITILRDVAQEPEIVELCKFLASMGCLIEGIGTDVLIIKGCRCLEPVSYWNPYDRIVAGTYILMAAALPSDFRLYGVGNTKYIENVVCVARKLGVIIVQFKDSIGIYSDGHVQGGCFQTGVYPAFPTDLQPVLITVLLKALSESCVVETIFEDRFGIVEPLKRLGGRLSQKENCVYIHHSDCLHGHTVKATDLRQGAALVVAGVLCCGYTTVTDIGYIERGYEDIVRDLQNLHVNAEYI